MSAFLKCGGLYPFCWSCDSQCFVGQRSSHSSVCVIDVRSHRITSGHLWSCSQSERPQQHPNTTHWKVSGCQPDPTFSCSCLHTCVLRHSEDRRVGQCPTWPMCVVFFIQKQANNNNNNKETSVKKGLFPKHITALCLTDVKDQSSWLNCVNSELQQVKEKWQKWPIHSQNENISRKWTKTTKATTDATKWIGAQKMLTCFPYTMFSQSLLKNI